MTKTIFNTYFYAKNEEQVQHILNVCIDNELPHWKGAGFTFVDNYDCFGFFTDSGEFFFLPSDDFFKTNSYLEVTESEWLELLKQHKNK